MVILSTSFVTPDWQIPGTSWAVILPLAYVYCFFLEVFLQLTNFLNNILLKNRIVAGGHLLFPVSWSFFYRLLWAYCFFIFPPFQIVLNPWLMIFSYWMFWTSLASITCYLLPPSHVPPNPIFFPNLPPTIFKKKKIVMSLSFVYWTLSLRPLIFFFLSFFPSFQNQTFNFLPQ